MNIIVIDNYDSFTYNLVHYLEDLDCKVTVKRNDNIVLESINNYDKILISPGPGIPDEAGMTKKIIEEFYDCLLYTSPSPRDMRRSRMPSSA